MVRAKNTGYLLKVIAVPDNQSQVALESMQQKTSRPVSWTVADSVECIGVIASASVGPGGSSVVSLGRAQKKWERSRALVLSFGVQVFI